MPAAVVRSPHQTARLPRPRAGPRPEDHGPGGPSGRQLVDDHNPLDEEDLASGRGLCCWGSAVALAPVPAELTANAWYYFGLVVAAVAALITEPLPGPVVGLVAVTTAATLLLVAPTDRIDPLGTAGFADSTVWLMLVVFMFALGYQATGLGRRIALTLVQRLGGRTLGLGYAVALADLALAPLTPSNTARSAGIIFPIIESIPPLYGSSPGKTARRIGAYLMWTAFGTTCVHELDVPHGIHAQSTGPLDAQELAGVTITWSDWFVDSCR